MPNVGGKKFPYTARGKKDAKRYARKTGQPMRAGVSNGYGQGMENRGGSRMMRNPGMAPSPRRAPRGLRRRRGTGAPLRPMMPRRKRS